MTALPGRVLRPQLIHTLVLAAMVAACNAGPAASPSPTSLPSASPSPTGTPAPTPSPTFNSEQIQHPTGATEIVLRMEQGGGFVPIDFLVTQAPQFTLYGDGTVVWRSSTQDAGRLGVGGSLPPFNTGKMNEQAVQALLAFALGTGRLANARDTYNDDGIADAPTTTFNLNAGGVQKVVSIYALGEALPGGPDAADRHGFVQLADLLNNFDAEAQSGTVDEIAPYDPELYRATMFEGMGAPVTEPIAWPWDDLKLADFPKGDEPGAVKVLTRDQIAKLTDVPNGGQMSIWVTAPDDSVVQFGIRPLLPDEAATFNAS